MPTAGFAAGIDYRIRLRPQHEALKNYSGSQNRIRRCEGIRHTHNHRQKALSHRNHLPRAADDSELQHRRRHHWSLLTVGSNRGAFNTTRLAWSTGKRPRAPPTGLVRPSLLGGTEIIGRA